MEWGRRVASLLLVIPAVLPVGGCKSVPFTAPAECKFTMSANPTEIPTSGAAATLTVTLLEKSGFPVPDGTVVTLTTTLGDVTAEVKTTNGVAKAQLSGVGTSGKATVTAFSGACGTATTDVTIGATPDTIALTATPASLPSGGGTVSLSATVFGANGSPSQGATVVFSSTQGSLGSAGSPQKTNANGQTTDTLTTTRTAEVTASSGGKSKTVTVTVGTSGISSIVLSADNSSLPSSGGTTGLVAVVLGDTGALPGVAVAWSATAGTLSPAGITVTDSVGVASNSLTTSAESIVTAAAGGKTATLTIKVGGAKANRVDIAVRRVGIQAMGTPDGFCSPGTAGPQLPFEVVAVVKDDKDNPLESRDVLFFVDLTEVDPCGRPFGEFCGSGKSAVTATTDSSGRATVYFTMTQDDLNYCNCLPSGTKCTAAPACIAPTCAAICTGTATSGTDQFCTVAIKAVSGGVTSTNFQLIEYNK